MKQMRLDKFLSEMGAATRSEAKQLVRKGKVCVNGVPAKTADMKLDPETDVVHCNDVPISYAKLEYYMLNKPAGVLSAANDKRAVTVVDLIESRLRKDLFPVGRLDKDTEGLLLISNDGALAHALLSPKKHVDKTYYVELDRAVSKADTARLEAGVDIGDEKPTLPCKITFVEEKQYHVYLGKAVEHELKDEEKKKQSSDAALLRSAEEAKKGKAVQSEESRFLCITIREGRFHQIKRMFATCGCTVLYLKRLSMGSLSLDETLETGAYRKLTDAELAALKNFEQ